MIKALKWAYKLGYDHRQSQILRLLETERDFHQSQSQIKSMQERDDKLDMYKDRPVKPEQHDERYKEVSEILNRIDPEKYPNIDIFLEMMK